MIRFLCPAPLFWETKVEIAIPIADLKLANPVGKNKFRSNFARNHRYIDSKKARRWEQSMWLPTFGGFHNMERYGTLVLK
jgi:hypothetical protein